MKHPTTRALHAYWTQVRGARLAPERDDIDPTQIRGILGDVFILDLDTPARTTFRLAGSRVCSLFGRDLKGLPFGTIWCLPDRPRAATLLDSVVEAAVVAVAGVSAGPDGARPVSLELSLLPLRHRGRTQARMLGSLALMDDGLNRETGPIGNLTLETVRFVAGNGWQDDARRPPLVPNGGRRVGRLVVFDGGRPA
jgi:hypothetical protein